MNTMPTDHELPSATLRREANPALQMNRRRFAKGLGIAGASLLSSGTWFIDSVSAERANRKPLLEGDAAILRFLAAAEILETDLWQQYTELALNNPPYADALSVIDGDMGQYIADNTADELSHATFLNAFLVARGAEPVNLEAFRTLPSSQATGAEQVGRLTNLFNLTVDTTWYTRYRGTGNPDFNDAFPQAVNITNRPAIPRDDQGTEEQFQALANVAAFHFASVEQGGASLYTHMTEKASGPLVLRIVSSIGGTEVYHFAIWDDKAGDAPPLTTSDGLVFPDLNADPATQTNRIMPKACEFISASLPLCSIIRPVSKAKAGAVAALAALTASGLFIGQSQTFFDTLADLARRADEATRTVAS